MTSEVITPIDMAIADENSEYIGLPRLVLMENAGASVAREVEKRLGGVRGRKVTVFAGLGNNGGDGFVAARHLAIMGAKVKVFLMGSPDEIKTAEAKANWMILERMFLTIDLKPVKTSEELLEDREEVLKSDVIVDALFGTGIKGVIREPYSTAIDLMNEFKGLVASIDVPSGVNPLTGEVLDRAVKASVTITMYKPKPGLIDCSYTGDLVTASIGLPIEVEFIVGPGDVKAVIKERARDSKKGDHGRVLVIGGSVDYSGAPALAALASLRTGCDIAVVAAPESVCEAIRSFSPNLIVRRLSGECLSEENVESILKLAEKADSVIIGPGLGVREETVNAVLKLVEEVKNPLVIDADGIKALARRRVELRGKKAIITPHAGEFKMLTGRTLPRGLEERMRLVKEASEELGSTILLKSSIDVVSDGNRVKVNFTGNPGMTVGGTGDVLTGVAATLLAWSKDPFRSACAAAFINGAAGDLAVRELGYHILATDVIERIPEVMKKFERVIIGGF